MTEPTPPLHVDRFRVPMADTDAAQIIYFGAPVRWAERLVTGYLADIGQPTSAMLASGHGMPAVDLHVTYRRPLRLDDQVYGEFSYAGRGSGQPVADLDGHDAFPFMTQRWTQMRSEPATAPPAGARAHKLASLAD